MVAIVSRCHLVIVQLDEVDAVRVCFVIYVLELCQHFLALLAAFFSV